MALNEILFITVIFTLHTNWEKMVKKFKKRNWNYSCSQPQSWPANHPENCCILPLMFCSYLVLFHWQVGLNKSYDLVFSRMMTQHMVTPDVQKFLMSLSLSGSKYFLTSTFPRAHVNGDLKIVSSCGAEFILQIAIGSR